MAIKSENLKDNFFIIFDFKYKLKFFYKKYKNNNYN